MIAEVLDRDEGMTLVELMMASMILFFAITAVFSLIIGSTNLSVAAKQQNIAINAANSYMEDVRSIPYELVGVPGQSVVGILDAETTTSTSGFSVSIKPTVARVIVTDFPKPYEYKKLIIVTAVTASNGGKTITRTFTTYVRKNTDLQVPPDWKPPTITFNPGSSPANGSAVSGTVYVQVTATAQMPEGTIQDVSIRCDTRLLAGTGTDSALTSHWGGLATETKKFDFWWDTTHEFAGGITLRDGPHWLVADVVDSIGQTKEVRIGIIIDNQPPTGLSEAPTVVSTSDAASTVTWGKAWDPEGPVDVGADCWGYDISLRQQPSTAGDWILLSSTTVEGGLTYPAVTTGLSRYQCTVTPVSLRGLPGPMQAVVWVSPPLASGTYANIASHGNDEQIRNTITLSAPTFENSARVYTLYRSTSLSGPSWAVVNTDATLSPTQAYTYADTLPLNESPQSRYYYRAQVVITPSGLGDPTPVELQSNIIGPNGTSGSGTLVSQGW